MVFHFFFFYVHYFVSGKCHVVHSPRVGVLLMKTTTNRGVRKRQHFLYLSKLKHSEDIV